VEIIDLWENSINYKMKILIEGWFSIPHSYAIVNCFQLYSFYKIFPKDTIFYIKEVDYCSPAWNNIKDEAHSIYPEYMRKVLLSFPKWKKQRVDVIYRIAYPYNIQTNRKLSSIPIVVFYTTELYKIMLQSFYPTPSNDKMFTNSIQTHKNIHFICPSKWSQNGMRPYVPEGIRNTIINHGVSTDVFYKDYDLRQTMRSKIGIDDDSIVFLHGGAMTKNKGILETLHIMYTLIINYGKSYKLILKCSDSLYASSNYIQNYFTQLQQQLMIPPTLLEEFKTNIIFIHDNYTFEDMNMIYNACDVYISPYLAEGFNLMPLEALAVGCRLIITDYGSSNEYLDVLDKYTTFIKLPSTKFIHDNGNITRKIDIQLSLDEILNNIHIIEGIHSDYEYIQLLDQIQVSFSWDHIAQLYLKYFQQIIK